MEAWITAIVLVTAALTFVPSAEAHQCNGMDCGPCVKGETHNHNDARGGQCSSGPGYIAENGYGGQSFTPGTGALAGVLALAGAALVVRGRRG